MLTAVEHRVFIWSHILITKLSASVEVWISMKLHLLVFVSGRTHLSEPGICYQAWRKKDAARGSGGSHHEEDCCSQAHLWQLLPCKQKDLMSPRKHISGKFYKPTKTKKKEKKKSSTWNLATTLSIYRVLGISKLRPQHVRKCNLYFTEIETHTLTALCLAASAPVHQKGTSPVLTAPTGNSPMQHTYLHTSPFITSQHSGTPPGLHSPAACKSSHTNCYLLTEPFAELLHFRPVLQSRRIL